MTGKENIAKGIAGMRSKCYRMNVRLTGIRARLEGRASNVCIRLLLH